MSLVLSGCVVSPNFPNRFGMTDMTRRASDSCSNTIAKSSAYPQDSNERFQFIRISSNPKLNLTQLLSLHLSTPRRVWRGPRDEGKEADQTEGGACFRFPSNKERLTPCCLSWIERGLQESAKTSRPHFCCYRFSVAIGNRTDSDVMSSQNRSCKKGRMATNCLA
jgi:hypothetical protein